MSGINIKKHEKVFQYIKTAVSLFDSGTTNLVGDNIFKFDRIVYILGDLIGIQGLPDNNDEKQRIITLGIKRFSGYRKKTLRWFKKALKTEIDLRNGKISKRFYVIFPLNIDYQTISRKRHFTIERMKLKIRSLSYVAREFDFKPAYRLLQERRENVNSSYIDFSYVIVELHAKTEDEAFWRSNERVRLFRSICNLVLSYGRITWQWGRAIGPLGKIHPPICMFVFDAEKKYITYWFTAEVFEHRVFKLEPEVLKGIKKQVQYFESLDSTRLKNVLKSCLSLYLSALDETERGYIFLNLWQILEFTALKDQSGITINKVKDRVKLIYKGSKIISDAVDALFTKRNHLVHEGKLSSFSLKDVNQIKGIAEGCITFLLGNVKRLKTTEALTDFYENIGLTGDRLQKKIAVIQYIEKLQTNK